MPIFFLILGYSIQYYYREWSAGQPDNTDNSEHCVSMDRNGKLNDISCDNETPFICQRKAFPNSAERRTNCYSDDLSMCIVSLIALTCL